MQRSEREDYDEKRNSKHAGARRRRGHGAGRRRERDGAAKGSDPDRRAVRPHRADADRRHPPVGGDLKGKKIAYVYYDNPAGREALPILEDLQKTEGYEMRTFAVPPPGVEMGAQVLDITQRYHPDFIIDHLFGRSPSVAIKEYKRAGFPLSKVMGLVWASAEADIDAAGGWAVAEGYYTMSFAGVGDDYPVRQEIKAMYKKDGKEPPKEMDDTVMYNRGLLIEALHVEGIRNAVTANGGKKPTREQVKAGFRGDPDFPLGGRGARVDVTPTAPARR